MADNYSFKDGSGSSQTAAAKDTTGTGVYANRVVPMIGTTDIPAGHGTAATAMRVELPTDGTGVVGLNAGTQIVGKFGIDQTTDGTTNRVNANIAQVAGSSIATGHGTASGAVRVELPTDGTGVVGLGAGTQLIGAAIAPHQTGALYSGTTALTPKFAAITASSSGATTVVALVSGKKIRVLKLTLVTNGAVNIKFQSHVTPTDLTGLFYCGANGGVGMGYCPLGHFETVAGEALDINLSGAVAVGGVLTYVEV